MIEHVLQAICYGRLHGDVQGIPTSSKGLSLYILHYDIVISRIFIYIDSVNPGYWYVRKLSDEQHILALDQGHVTAILYKEVVTNSDDASTSRLL